MVFTGDNPRDNCRIACALTGERSPTLSAHTQSPLSAVDNTTNAPRIIHMVTTPLYQRTSRFGQVIPRIPNPYGDDKEIKVLIITPIVKALV